MTLEQLQQEIKEALIQYPELLHEEIAIKYEYSIYDLDSIELTEIIDDSSKMFVIKIY